MKMLRLLNPEIVVETGKWSFLDLPWSFFAREVFRWISTLRFGGYVCTELRFGGNICSYYREMFWTHSKMKWLMTWSSLYECGELTPSPIFSSSPLHFFTQWKEYRLSFLKFDKFYEIIDEPRQLIFSKILVKSTCEVTISFKDHFHPI